MVLTRPSASAIISYWNRSTSCMDDVNDCGWSKKEMASMNLCRRLESASESATVSNVTEREMAARPPVRLKHTFIKDLSTYIFRPTAAHPSLTAYCSRLPPP